MSEKQWKFVLGGSVLLSSSLLIYHHFNKYLKIRKKVDELHHEPIYSHHEINFNKLSGLGKKVILLKMQCKESQQYVLTSKVGSIQYFYDKFPIQKNLSWIVFVLNFHPLTWKQKDIKQSLITGKTQQRNIFKIEHKFDQKQYDFFGGIFFWLGTTVAFFVELISSIILFHPNSILIPGPQYGTLETTLKLITDRPLIVECEIQNGILTPKIMGLSKADIIQVYQSQKSNSVFQIFFWSIVLFFYRNRIKKYFIQPCVKFIQEGLESLFSRQKKKTGKMLSADVQSDLSCIICMNRCRNIIFQNCKHFSICNQCKNDYGGQEIDRCPLCRKETDDKYIIVEEEEQQK